MTHKDDTGKSVVVATWTPPQDFDGSVVFRLNFSHILDLYSFTHGHCFVNFRASFVKSFAKFWVKQASPVVRVKKATVVVSSNVAKEETTTKKPITTTSIPSSNSSGKKDEDLPKRV